MGLLNSSLQIGRAALLSYQSALQVVGNNISSAASPDYTRLSPQLDPLQGNELTRGLQPGAGVALTDIQRNLDEALESRLRLAVSSGRFADTVSTSLAQVEALFDERNENGLGSRMRAFFGSFDHLQNSPEDRAARELTLSQGTLLAGSLQDLRSRLAELGSSIDAQIGGVVETANQMIRETRDLNERITRAEAGGNGQATGLRDQRDALLRRLSEFFEVRVHEQPNGAINLYLGSEALVQGSSARELTAVRETEGEFTRTSVRFADTGAHVPRTEGGLSGLMDVRDLHAYGRLADLDRLAGALIADVNRIHADGQGLVGLRSVTGAYDVLATDVSLNAAGTGLAAAARNGSFFLTVADDATGTPVTSRIELVFGGAGADPSLESLVADVNAQVEHVTASITADRRLSIVADTGFSFTFGNDGEQAREDTSGILSALGVNAFFKGHDARDIAVHDALLDNPLLLAAASSLHPGDGINAGRIAALDTAGSEVLDGASLLQFQHAMVGDVAVATAAARDRSEAADTVLTSLQAQKEAISGVSLDEEAIALLKYERAFQGASRFVAVVDGLLQDLVSLIR